MELNKTQEWWVMPKSRCNATGRLRQCFNLSEDGAGDPMTMIRRLGCAEAIEQTKSSLIFYVEINELIQSCELHAVYILFVKFLCSHNFIFCSCQRAEARGKPSPAWSLILFFPSLVEERSTVRTAETPRSGSVYRDPSCRFFWQSSFHGEKLGRCLVTKNFRKSTR